MNPTRVLRQLLPLLTAGLLALASAAGAQTAERAITIALAANVNTLDPHKSATVGTDLSVISHLYTPLLIRGPDLKLAPALARSWKAVDESTWRFELQPGVTFANGEKLDAEAVKWNVQRVLDPKTGSRIKQWFEPIREVRVVSPTVVEFVTGEPYPALADQMSMFFLLPPKWAAEKNPAREAMGTGPYDLKQFVSGDRVVLEAKASYWGDKPAFKEVVFRVIPEDSSRIAALLSGEVDLIDGIPPSEIKRINSSGKAKAGAISGTRVMFVKYNNLKAPFKDNRTLRQALNYAVDKQGINASLLGGLAKLSACQVPSEAYFGFNPELKPIAYDPKKARELLAKAGIPKGTTIELEVPLGRYLLAQEVTQAVAAQLEEVGLKVKLVELEFGRWLEKYRTAGNLGQMSYLGQGWPTLDADGLLTLFEPGNPYAYYENEDFARAIRAARSIVDPMRRKELYKKATRAMCDDPPVIFLFTQPTTYAQSPRIAWKARGDDWLRAYDIAPRS